jgi:Arc/MetJ-type ribon-helix-helix transcriptional regulator
VSYTVRLSLDELDQADDLLRTLRRDTGRRLDRSEVIRALLALAATDDRIRGRVAKTLSRPSR